MKDSVGLRIKMLRHHAELSQQQLAAEIGVSRATVCRWEAGDSKVGQEELQALAKLFRVSTDYVLGTKDQIEHPLESFARVGDMPQIDIPIQASRRIALSLPLMLVADLVAEAEEAGLTFGEYVTQLLVRRKHTTEDEG